VRLNHRTVKIACDESGADGENLVEGGSRVFSHGSTDLDCVAAAQFVEDLRAAVRFAGPELKSTLLLRSDSRRSSLLDAFAPDGPLSGRAKILLIDKPYMAAAKVIDLVIEEDAYANGIDLYGTNDAYRMAQVLFRDGPRAFGEQQWQKLLGDFVSFVRRKQRSGAKTTESELLQTIDDLRLRNNRRTVTEIMQRLWQGREHLRGYAPGGNMPPASMGALEPLVPALVGTANAWLQVHRVPIEVLHDRQAALTPQAVADILAVTRTRWPNMGVTAPISTLEQTDSRSDPRVQVADLVAGVGSWAAGQALAGTLSDYEAEVIRPYLIADSMWGHLPSWIRLYGKALR
jgi:hypothetical protein